MIEDQIAELDNSEKTKKTLREIVNDTLGMPLAQNRKEALSIQSTIRRADPNAKKLSESLRSSGYNNYRAIEDILDNSFDADTKEIDIEIKATPGPRGGVGKIDYDSSILIKDKGCGMDEETLFEGLRYGSDTPHDPKKDKGKFGMGLNTASTSIGRRCIVLTRKKEGKLLCGILDLDLIEQHQKFVVDMPKATAEDLEMFNEWAGPKGSGTIVTLCHIDSIKNSDPIQFANYLRGPKSLGRVFRYMLDSKKITVNGQAVKAFEPMLWGTDECEHWTPGWRKMKIETTTGRIEWIKYRIGQRRSKWAGKAEGTQRAQGLIWVRSNREIARTDPLGIWTQTNETYGLFIELKWDGDFLDYDGGIEFTKTAVEPSRSLIDRLVSEFGTQVKAIKDANLQKKIDESKATSEMEKVLKARGDLNKSLTGVLDLPDCEEEVEGSEPWNGESNGKGRGRDKTKRNPRTNGGTIKRSSFDWTFTYNLVPYTRMGPLWNADWQVGTKEVIINLNEDHPFIAAAMNSGDDSLMEVTLSVLDSWVFSEGQLRTETEISVMDQIKQSFGNNLRVYATNKMSLDAN